MSDSFWFCSPCTQQVLGTWQSSWLSSFLLSSSLALLGTERWHHKIYVLGLCGMGREGPSSRDYPFGNRVWVIFINCSKRKDCRRDQINICQILLLSSWLCPATSGRGYLHPNIWMRRAGKRPVKAPGRDGPAS